MAQQQQGELNNALFEAVKGGNVEECRLLIEQGAFVHATDNKGGGTPLHWAAANGRVEVCRLLIERGANVNATNWIDWTPLHQAAANGRLEVCRLLLDRGANVNATNSFGWTPLHDAASEGHVEVCRLLIQADANVNATMTSSNWTPLHLAAANGRVAVCRLLLELGADVHAANRFGWTPLDLAINIDSVEVLAYFYVHSVVNFHVVDHTGRRPWDNLTAQQQGTLTEAKVVHQEKIAILQTKGLPNELARLVMGYV